MKTLSLPIVRARRRISWDDLANAKTKRGWATLTDHPDRGPVRDFPSHIVGYYLTCDADPAKRPDGRNVLACAYIERVIRSGCVRRFDLGSTWCATIDEAKRFVVDNVSAYFGAWIDAVCGIV